MEISGLYVPFVPIGGTNALSNIAKNKLQATQNNSLNFADLLNQELVKFSDKAQNSIINQEMDLNNMELIRLDEAIEKAKSKDLRESLVMLDDKMFLVSIDTKTVLNMFEKNKMSDNIITNIDSAIIA